MNSDTKTNILVWLALKSHWFMIFPFYLRLTSFGHNYKAKKHEDKTLYNLTENLYLQSFPVCNISPCLNIQLYNIFTNFCSEAINN